MKKYNCALSLLLIICIMCCAVFGSVEFSNALVLNPWTIAICGALLTAAGLSFSSSSDMEAAAGSFAGSVSASIMSDLQAKAEEYKASNDNGFFLTLGADIIAAISGWLSGVTAAEGGSVVVDVIPSSDVICTSYADAHSFLDMPSGYREFINVSPVAVLVADSYSVGSSGNYCSDSDLKTVTIDSVFVESYGTKYDNLPVYVCGVRSGESLYYLLPNIINSSTYYATYDVWQAIQPSYIRRVTKFGYVLNGSGLYDFFCYHGNRSYFSNSFLGASLSLSTSIPFDDVWAPDSEDESKSLVPGASVKLPKGLVQDGALDSDVIGSMTPESVRAGTSDIPDVIAGTGTITGTGEGTGIFEGIGSLVLSIPLVGTIASTLSGILEAIRGFFDVSKFDLNFDSLKIGLTKVFPFCIPFDFFNAVKMFSSDASTFVFDINLETEYFTIDHTVDLTPFRLPILFFRYVVVFWFGFILISRTKDFMKW